MKYSVLAIEEDIVLTRIICDTYSKKEKQLFGDDPTSDFNQKILAVNNLYGWLYDRGILEKVSFEFKDHPDWTCFAFDARDLFPYRAEMEESGVEGAVLAAHHIFDEPYSSCLYSGAIELGWMMSTYRDVDGCVGRSWECDLIKGLNTEAIYDISKVKDERGVKEAVRAMFAFYDWPEQVKKTNLDSLIQNVEDKTKRSSSVSDREVNGPEH